jgi:SAM-dependent methyltransferase
MFKEPFIGDAFGDVLRAALAAQTGQAGRQVIQIVERSDGAVRGLPATSWLAGVESIAGCEQRALERVDGRVLDIGAGAGRMALPLQERGLEVTALDVSPGAVEVCRARGLRSAVCATVDQHAKTDGRYDMFMLFGANLGLLESRDRAPAFLSALAAMARPGAKIVGSIADPYTAEDPLLLSYHEMNRAAGRMAGQMHQRIRYRNVATGWYDYLLCSVAEMEELLAHSGWALDEIDEQDHPIYTATIRRVG